MDIDHEKLRKLEEDLADRLENTVRKRVVAYFTAMGVFVSGVLGFFGYNVIQSTRIAAEERGAALVKDVTRTVQQNIAVLEADAKRDVDQFLGEWQERVKFSLNESDLATRRAYSAALETFTRLEILDDHLERREEKLLDAETEAQKRSAQLTQMQKNVADTQSAVAVDVKQIRDSLDGVKAEITAAQSELIKEIQAQSEALRSRSSDQVQTSREGLSTLASGLDSLALQVEQLSTQLVALQTRVDGSATVAGVDEGEIDKVRGYAQSQQIAEPQAVVTPDLPVSGEMDSPLVYIQFAGVGRDRIEEISDGLRNFAYDVPGEERLASAAGKHEIRYFWVEDREAAETLAEVLSIVLGTLGYEDSVRLNDLTRWTRSPKPNPNTLELWLEPIPKT